MMNKSNPNGNKLLWRYLGFSTQVIVTLALAVWAGMRIDAYRGSNTLVWSWVLPLIVIIYFIYMAIKDTSKPGK